MPRQARKKEQGKWMSQEFDENNEDNALENIETLSVSDEEVIAYIKQIGFQNVSQLQRLEKEKRNEVIRAIKRMEGVSIKQMARITGISNSVIGRI